MRLPRVVASATLIVALALVAVPGSVGSRTPDADQPFDPSLLEAVELRRVSGGTAMTTPTLDPAHRSDGALDTGDVMLEPADGPAVPPRAAVSPPGTPAGVIVVPQWHNDPNISWYGPGFYGSGTACGQTYTRDIIGVAHRTLPCGTKVTFRNPANGRVLTVPVIDRGPYVAGRTWDLSAGACKALAHCYTGSIQWKMP